MTHVQVAYASAYMDLSKIWNDPTDYLGKHGIIYLDTTANEKAILENVDYDPALQIYAYIDRAQKSKHGRALVVLSGILVIVDENGQSNNVYF